MVQIPSVDACMAKPATYNAVKIQINNPRTNVPENCDSCKECNNEYNSVDLEVNDPAVEKKPVYDYPESKELVTADRALIRPANLPLIPVGYQTNYVNNRTFVNNEFEFEPQVSEKEEVEVPEANYTTVEEQKEAPDSKDVAFHGLNFKGAEQLEIVPPVDIKPEVDVAEVVKNLSDSNYDTQAKQIAEIMLAIKNNPEKADDYVVTDIFSGLIDIVKKDTNGLVKPDEQQNDIRKKYIINTLVKEQAEMNGEDPNKAELPYALDDSSVESAIKLTEFEQAERNKDYAMSALAVLSKTYADGMESKSGNTVPLTDLPGVSEFVDILRFSSNPDLKFRAIEALMFISRDEYKDELKSILALSAQDEDPAIAQISTAAVKYLDEN